MNFLFKNKSPETKKSRKRAITKTMRLDEESALFKDIPYKINTVIDIGIWINKLTNNSEGGKIDA